MMTINQIISSLREKNIKIWLEEGSLKYKAPKGAMTTEVKDLLKANKVALVKALQALDSKSNVPLIKAVDRPAVLPLSSAQERIWFACQFEAFSPLYNMVNAFEMEGALDIDKLQEAFAYLLDRHDILRANFLEEEGQVKQIIHDKIALRIEVKTDFADAASAKTAFEKRLKEERQYVFDLTGEALIKIGLIEVEENKWYLWLNQHHIITDGWSSNIMLSELFQFYNRKEGEAAVPEMAIQYSDYVLWEQELLSGADYEKLLDFWTNNLGGAPELSQIPSQRPRQNKQTFKSEVYRMNLDKKPVQKLLNYFSERQVTPFMVFLSIYTQLIFRYSKQEDIVLGTASANRSNPQVQSLIGCFINVLPLRMTQDASLNFTQYVEQVKTQLLSVYEHEKMPFNKIVDAVNPVRTLSYNPIVQMMFNMDTTAFNQVGFNNFSFAPFETSAPAAGNYDLVLELEEEDGNYQSKFTYNADLYDAEFIQNLARHYANLIQYCAEAPNRAIPELELLNSTEKENLLNKWNGTTLSIPETRVHARFEEKAVAQPDAIALVTAAESLSYQELNERANQFAHYLLSEQKVKPEEIIAIYMDRSAEMLISLLGIWKAGAAYLPLDPSHPKKRLNFILEDAGVKFLVSKRPYAKLFDANIRLVCYDELNLPESNDNPNVAINNRQLAYVIYTSGSSGLPKGTLVEHRSVLNFFLGMNERFGEQAGSLLSVTTIAFDISVLELFWTLSNGYKVVLHDTQLNNLISKKSTGSEKANVDFSLFYFSSSASDGLSGSNKYDLLLEGAKYADAHGFKAVWTPERHFHEFGGLYPNPSVTGAAIAALTRQIEVRAGSVVIPLHHPLRVAEEWSVLDNISGGRVGVSFASGWQVNDFVFAKDRYRDPNYYFESIQQVKRLWRGEAIEFENGKGEMVATKIFPQPVQKELPVWITSSGNINTFKKAGEQGANLLTHLLTQTMEELTEKITAYKEARQANGFDPEGGTITLMLHTFIGEDLEEVKSQVYGPFTDYLRTSIDLMKNIAEEHGIDLKDPVKGPDLIETILPLAFERYVNKASLIGTIESCSKVMDQAISIGVNEIACLIDFGMPYQLTMDALDSLTALKDAYKIGLSVADQIKAHNISHIQCTPSLAELLIADEDTRKSFAKLQYFFVGGEKLTNQLARAINSAISGKVYNMYGPTETTIWSSTEQVNGLDPIYIGQPIVNTQFYILDEYQHPVPAGIDGELYIGGDGLARGYLFRTELTEERFIKNPFTKANSLIYRTGDRVRFDEKGNITFIERVDNQLKINGHRVEMDEIQQALVALEEVQGAIVLNSNDSGKNKLIAHLIVAEAVEPSAIAIRSKLREKLPTYMIPAVINFLDEWPMTPNGKLDFNQLKKYKAQKPDEERSYVAPQSKIERTLSKIWEEVLGLDQIGIENNFFELGGDSIQSIQIISRARAAGLMLTPNQLFQHQTIRELAEVVSEVSQTLAFQGKVAGPIPISPIQHWFAEQRLANPHQYNQAILLEVPAEVKANTLEKVVAQLHEHHDVLRMRFSVEDTQMTQENLEEIENLPFVYQDLSAFSFLEQDQALKEQITKAHTQLDLSDGPLSSFQLFYLGKDRKARLLIVIHHLIVDGISWRILIEDLYQAYTAMEAGQAYQLPPKTASFKDWVAGLETYSTTAALQEEKAFWLNKPYDTIQAVPTDYAVKEGVNTVATESTIKVSLPKKLTQSLLTDLPKAYKTQINDILLTALLLAYRKWSGQPNLLLDLEGHGREDIVGNMDVFRTMGWFTSLFPVLLELPENRDMLDVLKSVKEQLRSIPNNGIGYGVLRYLNKEEDLQKQQKPSLIFNYLGQTDQAFADWAQAKEEVGQAHDPSNQRAYLIDIIGMVNEGKLQMVWNYSRKIHKQTSIRQLAKDFIEVLKNLIAAAKTVAIPLYSPGDFPLAQLDQNTLDRLVAQHSETAGVAVEDIYRLSPMQGGMLFHILQNPDSDQYFQQFSISLNGTVDPKIMQKAWQYLVDRHEVFRTSYHWEHLEEPLQIVQETAVANWEYVDWKKTEPADKKAAIQEILQTERKNKTGLGQVPLIKAFMFRLEEGQYIFSISFYHLLMDGWSLPIIFQELLQVYAQVSKKETVDIGEAYRYRDYIAWLDTQNPEEAKSYWTHELKGFKRVNGIGETTQLSTDEEQYTEYGRYLKTSISEDLRTFSKKHKITQGTFLQAIWTLVLNHYSGDQDIVFGSTVSGRSPSLKQVTRIIGLFINTLPVRINIDSELSILDWLQALQQGQQEREKYAYYGLSDILACSELPGTATLFESILVIENYPLNHSVDQYTGIEIGGLQGFEQNNYPLTALIIPGEELLLKIMYDQTSYEDQFIIDLVDRFEWIAENLMKGLDQTVGSIPGLQIRATEEIVESSLQKEAVDYVAPRNATEQQLVTIWEEVLGRKDIGIHHNFFDLGGQSLKTIRLTGLYHEAFGVLPSLQDFFDHTTIAAHAQFLTKATKQDLGRIKALEPRAHYSLSDAQRRLWFVSQFEEGSRAYNVTMAIEIKGALDVAQFQHAFDAVIERHEVLRTVFRETEEGDIAQWILSPKSSGFQMEYLDLIKEKKVEKQSNDVLDKLSRATFDLEKGPLLKAILIRQQKEHHLLCFSIHHIISDAWSMEILSRDVLQSYAALTQGLPNPLTPLDIQYRDFAAWQSERLKGSQVAEHREYWANKFEGELSILELPTEQFRPLVKTYNGSSLKTTLPATMTQELKALSQAQEGTLFMGVLSCVKGFLHRYTNQEDIILGCPVAGREHPDLKDQIGFYINTLALRTEVKHSDTFAELFEKIKETTIGAFEHQDYPFDQLIEDLELRRDTGRTPLFDIMVVFNNESISGNELQGPAGLRIKTLDHDYRPAKFDITFYFVEQGEELMLDIEYNTDIYSKVFIQQLATHFQQFTQEFTHAPQLTIAQVPYLKETEQAQLLESFNNPKAIYAKGKTAIDLFDEQVARTPDDVILVYRGEQMTFTELDELSNQFAQYLMDNEVLEPDNLVGIKLERSEWIVISILAVLKTGAAYVPIDPAYSKLRIDYILDSSDCVVVIEQDYIWEFLEEQDDYETDRPESDLNTDSLAYVMYTSGSTGQPKGVMIEHRELVNRLYDEIAMPVFQITHNCCMTSNFVFDASLLEVLMPLCFGGKIVIPIDDLLLDSAKLIPFLIEHQINILHGSPTYVGSLFNHLDKADLSELNEHLKIFAMGGESLSTQLVQSLKQKFPGITINNHYGPTEAIIDTTVYAQIEEYSRNVIGRPLGNTKIYILDPALQLVPIGVIGEIYIAGDGLARGYLNRPDLTKERFIADPFENGSRMYRSGDLARWLADGMIEYIGRKDNQVNIRGYRIELGEIENVLMQQKDLIKQVVVEVREVQEESVIAAYIVPKGELDKKALKEQLSQYLPGFMLPSYYVEIEEIPLTKTGKLDRKALPELEAGGNVIRTEYVAPRNELEEQLIALWNEILGVEKIGIKDDFFDLGGNSLKLIKLHRRINERYTTDIDIATLFRHLTVKEISEELLSEHATAENGTKSENGNLDIENTINVISFENEE